jgi:hypothetical protein
MIRGTHDAEPGANSAENSNLKPDKGGVSGQTIAQPQGPQTNGLAMEKCCDHGLDSSPISALASPIKPLTDPRSWFSKAHMDQIAIAMIAAVRQHGLAVLQGIGMACVVAGQRRSRLEKPLVLKGLSWRRSADASFGTTVA